MRYSDEDFLRLVGDERKRSIGFGEGNSSELETSREKALAYYRGEMTDVPAMANRSKAVSTDVAEAIETVLPDLIEIFIGGDDVATFQPQGEDDEQKAQEETDMVNHVVFTENEGFLTFYTAFKDALLTRTGLFHWYWEEEEKDETEANVSADMLEMAQAVAEMGGLEVTPEEEDDGTFSLKSKHLHGKVCIKAVPPEDFTVAADTINLAQTTYCAMRDRPRVQDLIARGVDADKARELPAYGKRDDTVDQARDRAGEHDQLNMGGSDDLRIVEVRAHYIRLDADGDGKLEIWRVVTDSEERILLDKEQVDQIPFGALTPYIVAHRFYGESVADKLLEIQRIKTALLRMLLDSGYFALNQRMEVSMAAANEWTLVDLIRNEPNVPVRSKDGQAVRPLTAGGLNFDAFAALEHVSVMGEQRTGIVRNAQGLNPETLHDTAKGAMALMSAAQKRVRLIARVFAETGVKDLFLGVHALLRKGHTEKHAPLTAKLGKSWKTAQPNEWDERCAMAIHVGVGSAGKDHDMMVSTQRLELMERLMMAPGAMGVLIDAKNIHEGLSAWERAAGNKSPETYWSDPAQAPPQPPKPDPEMEKAKAELQLKQQEGQANLQMKAQEGQMKAQLDAAQGERDHQLAVMKLEAEMGLKREQIAAELQLKREQLTAELELKRELGYAQAEVARETGMAKAQSSTSTSGVEAGGEPG